MSNETPQQQPPTPTEAQQQSRARAQQLANAFQSVFGLPGARSANQLLILEHLRKAAGTKGNVFRFGECKDGVELIVSGIQRTGAVLILEIIDRQISLAGELKVATEAKSVVKVKR
jgi:hypothetical protein